MQSESMRRIQDDGSDTMERGAWTVSVRARSKPTWPVFRKEMKRGLYAEVPVEID